MKVEQPSPIKPVPRIPASDDVPAKDQEKEARDEENRRKNKDKDKDGGLDEFA